MRDENKTFSWRGLWDRTVYEAKRVFSPVRPSLHDGMGALPNGAATTFRVWAPHATQVFVVGSFNKWSAWRHPLAAEGNGRWSADIPQARAGDRYKYLIHNHESVHLRTDPYALDVVGAARDGVVTAVANPPEPLFSLPPLRELVIYELHVGTFGDTCRDVVGTFAGVIDKLPYLQELGINAIEVMPVAEFAGDYSWGYNPAFPFAITRTYGGAAAFRQLVEAAHAHGIGVIMDVVYNHFGPQDLSMWQFDGWAQNGKGGIYFYNDWRSKTPWADTRPDYGRAEVRQFIFDNVRFWLETMQVDGLRWDATNFIRNVHGHDGDGNIPEGWGLMQTVTDLVRKHYPDKVNIAEDLQGNGAMTAETAVGGAGFHAQWDANFVHPVRHAVITPRDEERDMVALAQAIVANTRPAPWQRIIYTESHDEVANGKARVPEEISPGSPDSYFARKRSTMGAALVFTAPGVPMIFQGQEFLRDGWFDDQRPLAWERREQFAGIWHLYRDLIRLRRNLDGISHGLMGPSTNVFRMDNDEKLLAFHRWEFGGPGDDVIVVANFSHLAQEGATIGLPRPGIWRVRLNSDDRRYGFNGRECPDVVAAKVRRGQVDGLAFCGNVTIAPYSFLVLSQD